MSGASQITHSHLDLMMTSSAAALLCGGSLVALTTFLFYVFMKWNKQVFVLHQLSKFIMHLVGPLFFLTVGSCYNTRCALKRN